MQPRTIGAKSTALSLLLFLTGVVVGGGTVAVFSSRASRLYTQMLRVSFVTEQDERLAKAWRAGDAHAAVAHAACALETATGAHPLEVRPPPWPLGFPIVGALTSENTRWAVKDNSRIVALAHAKLGAAWERIGQGAAAQLEYSEAARLGGSDAERWRTNSKAILEQAPPQ
jgi:hypothetical protein